MIDPAGLDAVSDAVVGLFVAIPVLVVAGGVAVGLRVRGRGTKGRVPPGEVASDAATDIELERSTRAARRAQPTEVRPAAGPVTPDTEAPEAAAPADEITAPEPVAPEPVAAEPVAAEPVAEPPTYRSRLGKARGLLSGYLGTVRSMGKIDAGTWDDLEEALIRADVGVGATDALLNGLRTRVKGGEIVGPDALVDALKSELVSMLTTGDASLALPGSSATPGQDGPAADGSGSAADGQSVDGEDGRDGEDSRPVDVWLFVGVNGVGKTTTVGKVANRLSRSGTKVLLAAGDTFRAAAGEQLTMWASRADADIVRGSEGGDPSSVVFDAVQRAASRGHAVVLADTAGRLHNKVNLIEELKKIRRVADRPPGRVVEVLLVLDATTGQNGLAQAKVFLDAVDVSGVVLTKLDGTAKGGIVVAIQRELGLPVKLVGLGEGVEDLIDFDAAAFVDALF